jgi:hypothetical protein
MATISELKSLEDINYKSRVKVYFYPLIAVFLFTIAFLNFYPIGEKLKTFLKTNLQDSACNPDYDKIRMEWLLPKLVITDLVLPPGCLGASAREAVKFNFVNVNFQFINFSPFGFPFKVETEMNAQPLSFYFVQGFGERMLRLKDQSLVLSRLAPVMGGNFKLAGNMTLDLNVLMNNENTLKNLSFKAQSKDLQIPSQSLQGFTVPNLKLKDFFIEANSDSPPRIRVENFILGDPESPVRAKFNGSIDLQQDALQMSPVDLNGEVAFSESFQQTLPIIDMMFQSFSQKDGFYQVRLGGTLGSIKPTSP